MIYLLVLALFQTLSDATTSTAAQDALQAPAPAAVFAYNNAEVLSNPIGARRSRGNVGYLSWSDFSNGPS